MADTSNDRQTQAGPATVTKLVDGQGQGGLLLSIDYIWDEHSDLKALLQDFITKCSRTIAPTAHHHQLSPTSPHSRFAVKFRCTTPIEVPEEVFCTAVGICRGDARKQFLDDAQQ